MKLPDFILVDLFNKLRDKMGAKLIESFAIDISSVLTIADLEEMTTKGKDIELDEIRVLEDGTLAYKDSRVLLHIRDVGDYGRDKNELPRFHFSDCSTLQNMKKNQRFYRYVISIRTDGYFDLNIIRYNNPQRSMHKLQVCMNCLSQVNYKGCQSNIFKKKKLRDDFSIDEYFSIFPRSLFQTKPRYTSADAPINDYPPNWAEVSTSYKNDIKYRCENTDCNFDLNSVELRKYLHVHHKNGAKNDCSRENLKALCITCHADEIMHSHLKSLPEYKAFKTIKFGISSELSDSVKDKYEVASLLAKSSNINISDHRGKGGAFWVEYNAKSGNIASDLEKIGFRFKEGRGWWIA